MGIDQQTMDKYSSKRHLPGHAMQIMDPTGIMQTQSCLQKRLNKLESHHRNQPSNASDETDGGRGEGKVGYGTNGDTPSKSSVLNISTSKFEIARMKGGWKRR